MQIIDVITYNGEHDILEIRLNILKDYVDQFIICEASTTFSGKRKPLYFNNFLHGIKDGRYNIPASTLDKIKYHVIDENYTEEEIALAELSPNTVGAKHWVHEFLQKESIKKALTHLNDNDLVFIGDVDEIWNPQDNRWNNLASAFTRKLKLKVYSYYLNNRSSEEFWGTLVSFYKNIKDECLNHLRSTKHKKTDHDGWHFTSMHHQITRKLTDSYTKESYATDEVMDSLEDNVKNNKDFLGRNFTYTIDETDLPMYIKSNKLRYKHLWK